MPDYLDTGIGTAGQSLSERESDSGHLYEVQSEFVISPTGTIYRNAGVGSAFVQILGLTTVNEYDLELVVDRKTDTGNVGFWFGGTDLSNGYLFQCYVSVGDFTTRVIEYTGGVATFHMQTTIAAAASTTITLKVRAATLELLEGVTSLGMIAETSHTREANLYLRSSAAVTASTGYHFDEASYTGINVTPVITLIGDNPQSVEQNDTYIELGATATDAVDENIVIDSSAVDTAILGNYNVTYDVTGELGAVAEQVIRQVIVFDPAVLQTPPYPSGIYPVSVLFTSADTSTDTAVGTMTVADLALSDGGGQASPASGSGSISIVGVLRTFNITTIRTTAGATLTYTYPLGEIWTAVPEEGGVLIDSSSNVVITNGLGTVQSNLVQPVTDYLLILRDAGDMPMHYARQWGQLV